jgi:NAD(P)H dehydrogenase (quinone)
MITVTGASGQLGRLAVQELLRRGTAADEIVAVGRTPEKLAGLGVDVRRADYERPETLAAALAGTDRLLFISGSDVGRRIQQHRNVVDAAVVAGVEFVAYTSILHADTTPLKLAEEHLRTEQYIAASGLSYAFLRNSWYTEIYTLDLAGILERGVIHGASGSGRIAGATRADYAAAAAAVVSGATPGVFELGGDKPFTLAELTAELSVQSGRTVAYQDLSEADYVSVLVGAGLPEGYARIIADSSAQAGRGALDTSDHSLSRLIGRPTTPLADAVAAELKAL